MTHQQMDPQEALSQLARIRLADTDLAGVLTRVAELAKASMSGAEDVSVTLIRKGQPYTAAFTGAMAIDLDETQYQEHQGPCLQAAADSSTIHVPYMAVESRWPEYAPKAVSRGTYSSLSIGMPMQADVSGALNIYGSKPDAFDDTQIALGNTFAGFAAVALANANLHDTTTALARQMRDAMEGRAVIEQAKGIIMGERRCTAEEAFAILARLSQDTNRRLRDVAAAMVDRASGT